MAVKRASIKDIARLAKTSHSTVSRALRGSDLVKEATAAKIRRIAEESGYTASAAARSLVTQRSNSVGVVVTSITDPFEAEVVRGIEDSADEQGFSLLLADSNGDPEREVRAVGLLEERRVDGIVVTSSRVGALYLRLLSRMRIPIVLLNSHHPSEFVHSVMIANAEASMEITHHLIQMGHRRIAYLGDRFGDQSDTERFTGYRRALNEAGLAFEPELVIPGDGRPEGGATAMSSLLALDHPPTAVVCYNDLTALGAMREARVHGLDVPADMSIVGFDDLFFSEYTRPPLTTVRQPMRRMGRLAMETLLRLLRGAATAPTMEVPGELILRESVAPPRKGR
jgi:DNA-binding LacI/PurR family transcriptional regulator